MGEQIVWENVGLLTTTAISRDFWVVSNETASVITFRVKVGTDEFKINTPSAEVLERGKIYNYTINVRNHKEAVLSNMIITDWASKDNTDMENDLVTEWSKLPNGVYAIDNDGDPVAYEIASVAPAGAYQGVAVVMKGKAFEVAKVDASPETKWAENATMTTEEAAYFSSNYITRATETIRWGYLKKPDGTYNALSTSSNQLPDNISAWTNGALADVDGKANTDRILAANVTIASVIRNYNDGSHGNSTSWYLPAIGQLAYMYMNFDKVNNLLTKINGTTLREVFWSSSVYWYEEHCAWIVNFGIGSLGTSAVTKTWPLRLVQDL